MNAGFRQFFFLNVRSETKHYIAIELLQRTEFYLRIIVNLLSETRTFVGLRIQNEGNCNLLQLSLSMKTVPRTR